MEKERKYPHSAAPESSALHAQIEHGQMWWPLVAYEGRGKYESL